MKILNDRSKIKKDAINKLIELEEKVTNPESDIVLDEETIDITTGFETWCIDNNKDSSKSKNLMEYLWKEGVTVLDCNTDISEEWFEPTKENKSNRSLQLFSIFDDHFRTVFPTIQRSDSDWDDAFNYWYDKQKSYCGY